MDEQERMLPNCWQQGCDTVGNLQEHWVQFNQAAQGGTPREDDHVLERFFWLLEETLIGYGGKWIQLRVLFIVSCFLTNTNTKSLILRRLFQNVKERDTKMKSDKSTYNTSIREVDPDNFPLEAYANELEYPEYIPLATLQT